MGIENDAAKVELLPTPKVADLNSVALSAISAGIVAVGSVRLSEVSLAYSADTLSGHQIPDMHEDQIPEPYDFFYEVVEDGRSDPEPVRRKFRLAAAPFMDMEQGIGWNIVLEKMSEDRSRQGVNQSA